MGYVSLRGCCGKRPAPPAKPVDTNINEGGNSPSLLPSLCAEETKGVETMTRKTRQMTQAGVLAALYVALTYGQNFIWPGSATMAIQLRLSEALGVFALFTPAAVPGLTLGCLLFNLSCSGALPFDWLVGSLATLLAAGCMYKMKKHPLFALVMPALFNAPLVGWELSVFIGDGFQWPVFWANALNVFLGEAIVMYTAGWALYAAFKKRHLEKQFFG